MTPLERNLKSRQAILSALRCELVGPDPRGAFLEAIPRGLTREQMWNEYVAVRQGNGEEILTRETPARRYGAGVLYPPEVRDSTGTEESESSGVREATEGETSAEPGEHQAGARRRNFDVDSDDSGITAANGFKPSAMGLSFVLDLNRLGTGALRVAVASRYRTGGETCEQADCGFYSEQKIALIDESNGDATKRDTAWWRRIPFHVAEKSPVIDLSAEDLESKGGRRNIDGVEGYAGVVALRWHVRRWPESREGQRLVTLSLVNESRIGEHALDAICLFQSGLVVEAPDGAIGDYPKAMLPANDWPEPLDDELVNRVIYSQRVVKAVGHGCAVDWSGAGGRTALWTDVMPAWEMAPMAFDVIDMGGERLRLPMRVFSEMSDRDSAAFGLLETLVSSYEKWIEGLNPDHFPAEKATANALLRRCGEAAGRMRAGLEHLAGRDHNVLKAFALANRAMLMAQHRRSGEARQPQFDGQRETLGSRRVSPRNEGRRANAPPSLVGWDLAYEALNFDSPKLKTLEDQSERPIGHWRPFQLAFLLMSIEGVIYDRDSADREIVDLIWFPTGGGKTEAYLGLAAFTVFYNVLSGRVSKTVSEPRAVSILMRYTLRLLTAQQFERAVKLFCAMEIIRKSDPSELGSLPFTVGLWVGGSNTPNKIDSDSDQSPGAKQSKRELEKNSSAKNPFVLLQCPWCGARFGHVAEGVVHGYRIVGRGSDAVFDYVCADRSCEFGQGSGLRIPAQIVDENLYEDPPTLLIGTVDKFAMLTWKPEARSFFGLDANGVRVAAGPTLIIQDEMHLMTGPLGTMVGLFETAVDALCRFGGGCAPKVVASTATAARAREQILALYGRSESMVFPPPGLDAADSFFAREDRSKPGRLYVGVLAPGHGSMQTTQRNVYAALAQEAAVLALEAFSSAEGDPKERGKSASEVADPWWTLLAYYNSLRELGGALTLFGADIPDQLGVLRKRRGIPQHESRRVYVDGRVLELTSRLDSGDVPQALRSLENGLNGFVEKDGLVTVQAKYGPQDACLASNIIEVGVDVPRLSLMAIVGQPKTTAAYIQASSRVGRREDRPGLVVMLYSSTKPRDRSHYERFRAYHQAIYAGVEPTSVTPFSTPVVDRALHAVIVSMLRQTLPMSAGPRAVSDADQAFSWIEEELRARSGKVARDDEKEGAVSRFRQLCREWVAYNPEDWGKITVQGEMGDSAALMYPAGREKPSRWGRVGWATPTSLRAVDATCEASVTEHYASAQADDVDPEGED